MNRRQFFRAAAPAALAVSLAGCSQSFQQGVTSFAQSAFTQVNTAAKALEAAIAVVWKSVSAGVAIAKADMDAAVAIIQPYVVPCCQLVVTFDSLVNQAIGKGIIKAPKTDTRSAKAIEDRQGVRVLYGPQSVHVPEGWVLKEWQSRWCSCGRVRKGHRHTHGREGHGRRRGQHSLEELTVVLATLELLRNPLLEGHESTGQGNGCSRG